MVEEAEALATILATANPLEAVELPLLEALDGYLARPIRSTMAHPRFDNSVVDGYAIRAEDGAAKRSIVGEQPAGRSRGLRLEKNQAIRIFTGAPIPINCTAVIMQEEVVVENDVLFLPNPVETGENIRRAGADLAVGQLIGQPNQRLTPQLIGLLASQGLATAWVHRQPKVTILSTGDELRRADAKLAEGEIYDSNGVMLAALLLRMGIVADVRHSRDDLGAIQQEIESAMKSSNVLIISGGVSVGDHDHVKAALKACGITLDLWRIRMKPGKPLAFANHGGRLIFGLPGNPVASFVTFLVLLRPALQQLRGARGADRFLLKRNIPIDLPIENSGDRPLYVRGRIEAGRFVPQGLQESHAIHGLSQSDTLLRVPEGGKYSAGSEQEIVCW